MTTDEFWELVELAKAQVDGTDDPECERQAELLEGYLSQRSSADIVDFDRIFDECMEQANDWRLWGAAYIINGGCSDDGFDYFRGWLIAQGRVIFEAAIHDPDSLAEVVDPQRDDYEGECMLYVADNAYEAKTEAEMPQYEIVHGDTRGERWTEDTLGSLLPRLGALYQWD